MNRLLTASLFASLSIATAAFAASANAKPPSGDANPGDRFNTTVDTTEIIAPKRLPPSGDLNPSDLHNATVDTTQVIAPQK